MSSQLRSVAVYCGSSSGFHGDYVRDASSLGEELGRRGITLVYGGGKVGLMGAVADGVLSVGGHVVGVITTHLHELELGHNGIGQLDVSPTMHHRKLAMADGADGFIALPGGFGTFDELCEVLTWTQLGLHQKPVALLNTRDYWSPFLAMADRAVEEGFLRPAHRELLQVASTPAEAIDLLSKPLGPALPKWVTVREPTG